MAFSLYSTVLHKYSYEEIRNLCFTEGSDFPLLFDCQWGIWRDKAVADFGVSEQFFDLIRTLSGPQRYLQIASYVKLTPLSGVRFYPDTNIIEGVYEAYEGCREAELRRDLDMLEWFSARLSDEQREHLKTLEGEFYTGSKERIENLQGNWEEEDREEEQEELDFTDGIYYLYRVIRQGRVDRLDQILHNYFTLPKGFTIEKDIPHVPFWEYYHQGTLYDLPLQETKSADVNYIIEAVMASADTRIADFFRSIFRDRDLSRSTLITSRESLLRHGKPEEAYGLALRFFGPRTRVEQYNYMVELLLLLSVTHEISGDDYSSYLDERLGNITHLSALLPYVNPVYVKEVVVDDIIFPLSSSLLLEYSQEGREPLIYS
nr:hypothetical protein Cduv_197 [Cedratvirus duvanny]